MKKYIITDEDLNHYHAENITSAEIDACKGGYLTIIRTSDAQEMNRDGKWVPIANWWK